MGGAIGMRAERHVVERLERAAAFDTASAAPLEGLRAMERRRLRRLVDRAIVVESAPGRFYVDRALWTARRSARRTLAFLLLAVLAGVGVLALVGVALVRRIAMARP